MSQKISFKQLNKYSQNPPECRILTLEFQNFPRGQTVNTPPHHHRTSKNHHPPNRAFGAQLLSHVQNSN